jgi:hypothetical protein
MPKRDDWVIFLYPRSGDPIRVGSAIHYLSNNYASLSCQNTIILYIIKMDLFQMFPVPQEKNNYCSIDMFDISKLDCDGTIEHGQIHSGSRCGLSVGQDEKQQLYCNQGYLYVSSEVGVIFESKYIVKYVVL